MELRGRGQHTKKKERKEGIGRNAIKPWRSGKTGLWMGVVDVDMAGGWG